LAQVGDELKIFTLQETVFKESSSVGMLLIRNTYPCQIWYTLDTYLRQIY